MSKQVFDNVSLIDFSSKSLQQELCRRIACKEDGICDFCEQRYTEPPCQEIDRHKSTGDLWHEGWKYDLRSGFMIASRFCGRYTGHISRYGTKADLFKRIDDSFSSGGIFETEIDNEDHTEDKERFIEFVNWANKKIVEYEQV